MKVAEFKPRTLDQNSIRAINALLQGAMDGEVTEVAYVAKVKGRWVYKVSTIELNSDRLPLIGMLEAVKQRISLMLDWGKL